MAARDESASGLLRRAVAHRDRYDLRTALELSLVAVGRMEAEHGPQSVALVEGLIVLASIQQAASALDAAEHAARRAVAIAESMPPDELAALLRVRAHQAIAVTLRLQGRYEDAEAAFRHALAEAEQNLRADAAPLADLLIGLAITFKYSGRFDEAEQLYRRALRIAASATADEAGSTVATIYHNLAGLEHARGNYLAAEPLARRAVELRLQAVNATAVDVAADKAALAAILDELGQSDEAEALLRDALAVYRSVYGETHYEVAVNLNNLAGVLHRRGRLGEAQALYEESLEIKQELLGAEHPELAATLNNIALLAGAQQRYDEAEPLFRRALTLLERAVDPSHPNLAACRANYATLLRLMDRELEAQAILA